VEECIEEYIKLSEEVFDVDQVLKGVIPVGDNQCRFNHKQLETAIQGVVKKKLGDENAIIADTATNPTPVPTFVVATKAFHADGPPTIFRSYRCTGHNADKCAIWEAGRATSAAPTFFKPIKIKAPLPGATYVDGGLAHNNLAELALAEAQKIWPNARKFCLVSVGTGRQSSVRLVNSTHSSSTVRDDEEQSYIKWNLARIPGVTTASRVPSGMVALNNIVDACVKLATNSESVHERIYKQMEADRRLRYHRFNVDRDMEGIGLQEWQKMEEMGSHTAAYMEEAEKITKKNSCVQDLIAIENE
jgi:patatin-like phospholipase/acyl hydrolase